MDDASRRGRVRVSHPPRGLLNRFGSLTLGLAWVYGSYRAVMLFFEAEACEASGCDWLFAGWHPLAWGALLLLWLMVVPIVGLGLSLPWSIPGILIYWLFGGWQDHVRGRVVEPADPDAAPL